MTWLGFLFQDIYLFVLRISINFIAEWKIMGRTNVKLVKNPLILKIDSRRISPKCMEKEHISALNVNINPKESLTFQDI